MSERKVCECGRYLNAQGICELCSTLVILDREQDRCDDFMIMVCQPQPVQLVMEKPKKDRFRSTHPKNAFKRK